MRARHSSPVRQAASAGVAAILLLATGCSGSDDAGPAATTTTVERSTSTPTTSGSEACEVEVPDPVATEPVPGVASDLTVTSFDGTAIRAHWFPTDATGDDPAPTVLMGPGWSLPGDTSDEGAPLFGALGIASLDDRGYNVLTWDPRGFGESEGTVTVNVPESEGHDTRVLIDWVSQQPEAALDAEGDPRMGMVGFSYGGGIQVTVASNDCRVDAIVPGLAWQSLTTSLYPAETVKLGWAQVLVDAAAGADLDPHITDAAASGAATGTISTDDERWFRDRGPGPLVEQITAPTLFVQGTVDTLFPLDEAVQMEHTLRARGVPTAMLWFCGGHGVCLTDEGDTTRVDTASFAWLDRWVKGDEDVDTGPAVDIVDQDGDRWVAGRYPAQPTGEVCGSDPGPHTLDLVAAGGSGPVTAATDPSDLLAGLVVGITPAAATHAVEVTAGGDDDALVVGAPRATLTYRGTVPDGPEPTRLFAQLVDDETGTVVGNQITPFPVDLDGEEHTVGVTMETVAQDLSGGRSVTLQVVATTVAFARPRLGGSVELSDIEVCLPTTDTFTPG